MRGIGDLREPRSGIWLVLFNNVLLHHPVVNATPAELTDFLHQPREAMVQLFEFEIGCRVLRTINIEGLPFQLLSHLFELDGLKNPGILIFGGLHPPPLVFHLLSELCYYIYNSGIIHAALQVRSNPLPQLFKHGRHLCI